MTALRARVHPYRRKLVAPFVTARGSITQREGCLLALEDDDGVIGRGEAAPAYWIDAEPAADVRTALEEVAVAIAALDVSAAEVSDLFVSGLPYKGANMILARVVERISHLPSARAAIDSACMELQALRSGCGVAEFFGAESRVYFDVSALLSPGRGDSLTDAVTRRAREGFATVKLKAGGADTDGEVKRLRETLRACAEFELRLRVDANRGWTYADASRVIDSIDSQYADRIDFVEEPLQHADAHLLARLRSEFAVPIALDESLRDVEAAKRFAEAGAMDVAVIKTARFGGLHASVAAAAAAGRGGVETVFTDSIETAVGMAAAAHTAAAHAARTRTQPPPALGLGGLALLEEEARTRPVLGVTATGPGLVLERGEVRS